MWIEIFKTGTHTDSSGRTESYNAEKLDLIAALYNKKVSESESNLAPIVKGHPANNDPAFGWVERLARRGTKLMAKLKAISPEFVEEVKNGSYKKISIALYNDLMLRHIGFLGAVPPAVDGLATISFADISGYLEFEHYSNISFDENENINENEYFYEIELLKNENNLYRTKIDQIEKEKRLKEFREYANSLIENINGSVITPAQVDKLIDILEMAHQSDNNLDKIEYSDNITNVEKVKQFISALQPVFNLKKYTTNEATGIEPRLRRNNFDSYEKPGDFSDKPVAAERLMLHNKAMEIKATTPGLSYEEAVCIAVGSI